MQAPCRTATEKDIDLVLRLQRATKAIVGHPRLPYKPKMCGETLKMFLELYLDDKETTTSLSSAD